MSQLNEIFSGFKNMIFPNEQINSVSEERLKRCFECPIRTEQWCDKKKGGCGCYLQAKTKSPNSSCPIEKW